jgi:hypothetical protein
MGRHTERKGLGGWLILIGLSIIMSPAYMLIIYVPAYQLMFYDGVWELLTHAGSGAFHPLWEPFLMGEIAVNVSIFAASLYLIYLFFTKHYLFPHFYIGIFLVWLVFIPFDSWLMTFIFPDKPVFDAETLNGFLQSSITGLISIPYLLLSQRVKATFVEKLPEQPMPLFAAQIA